MKKWTVSVLLTLFLVLFLPLSVHAADVAEQGSLSDTVHYTLYTDGKMVIEGTGEISGYYDFGYMYTRFPNVTSVVIGEGIEKIGSSAFYCLDNLRTVSLPSTLTEIGKDAFSNCPLLEEIVLPEGLRVIGSGAFRYDSSLTRIVIPASVTTFGDSPFRYCSGLKEVVFLGANPALTETSFYARDDYGEEIPLTAYYPDNGGWSEEQMIYPGRKTTWIPFTVDASGNMVPDESRAYLAEYRKKTSGSFNSDAQWYIDGTGVLHITGIGTITPNDLCDSYWKDITGLVVEPGITGLNANFSHYEKLKTVQFTDTLTLLPGFWNCPALETVDLGDAQREIPGIYDAPLIRDVTVPASIQRIGSYVYYACMNLETVTFLGSAPTENDGQCFNKGVGEITLYYPAGDSSWTEEVMRGLCGSTGIWIPYTLDENGNRIPQPSQAKTFVGTAQVVDYGNAVATLYSDGTALVEGTGRLSFGVGALWRNIHHVEIGEGITCLARFLQKEQLADDITVSFPESLVEIGDYAFMGLDKLTSLDLKNVEVIGRDAFYDCDNLETVAFNGKLKKIGTNAFSNCDSLSNIVLPEGLEEIGENAFRECASLESVEIPGSLKVLPLWAFSYCPNLTSVTLHEGLEYISDGAFYESGVREIVIPSTVKDLGYGNSVYYDPDVAHGAFEKTKLEKLTFLGNQLTSIPYACFYECPIQSVVIPEGVTQIAPFAFWGNPLEELVLPESLEKIGTRAFQGTKLTVVAIPAAVREMDNNCFGWCPELTIVVFKGDLPKLGHNEPVVGNEGAFYDSFPIVAYLEEYEASFASLNKNDHYVLDTMPMSMDDAGNLKVTEWDEDRYTANLSAAKNKYPEGYSLGRYSVSELNLTNLEGYGSQAFAYILSDELFDNMPSELDTEVLFDEVKVGDILRLGDEENGRAVVVTGKNKNTVTVAQGDWHETPDAPGTVHWGETLTRAQVEAAQYRITRYVTVLLGDPWSVPTYEPEWPSISGEVTEEAVQQLILSLKDSYPEGYPYREDITYVSNVGREGTACSAFAYRVSDMAFGTAPIRYVEDIDFDDIMVGDILHYDPDPGDNSTHAVVVMEVYQECLVTVEANYNEAMHWGSVFTREQVEAMLGYYTRYPEGSTHDEREAYTGELTDTPMIGGFYHTNHEDFVPDKDFVVYDAYTDAERPYGYEIPEGGVTMVFLFSTTCGYSTSMLADLDSCRWLDNPAFHMIAVETEAAVSDSLPDFIQRMTPNRAQYIEYCYTKNYSLHGMYSNMDFGDGLISWPTMLFVMEVDGKPVIVRARNGIISSGAIYACLMELSESFAFYEGHEHSFEVKKIVPPTCTDQGYTEYACACGKEMTEDFVDPLDHTWTDATCEAPKTCSACGETQGEPLKHIYVDGVCKLCGGEEPQGVLGDADGSGVLDYLDAVLVLRSAVGLHTLDPVAEALSNVNGDDTVDYLDAILILRAAVGLTTLK